MPITVTFVSMIFNYFSEENKFKCVMPSSSMAFLLISRSLSVFLRGRVDKWATPSAVILVFLKQSEFSLWNSERWFMESSYRSFQPMLSCWRRWNFILDSRKTPFLSILILLKNSVFKPWYFFKWTMPSFPILFLLRHKYSSFGSYGKNSPSVNPHSQS